MSTTLFANGTIVSATGRQAGDVLVDGETIVAVGGGGGGGGGAPAAPPPRDSIGQPMTCFLSCSYSGTVMAPDSLSSASLAS
jgi:hypothetical protein